MKEEDRNIIHKSFKVIQRHDPMVFCTFMYKGYVITFYYNSIFNTADVNYKVPREVAEEVVSLIENSLQDDEDVL
jgi:hypothetical protein